MKLYLFKRAADNKWIFGSNVDCLHDSGICRPVPSTDRSKLTIIYYEKNEANPNIYDQPVTDFLKEDGSAYANFAELSGVYVDFFMASIMATGGSSGLAASTGLGEVSLTVVEAQVAYSLPLDCDITKTPFVVYADGTTRTEPSEYTLSTELGIPTITFNVAPTVGNIPYILYTKVSIATQVEVTLTDNIGVTNGAVDAVLSDTVDLAHPGWICPRLLAGNIKFTDMEGNVDTWAFELKEFSPMRVKRVWLTGTTADMGIKVIY